MLTLFSFPSPNGLKVTIMALESGIVHDVRPVDITKGEQFHPEFLKISPNNKIPAMIDPEATGGPLALFESGAILEYLAEKSGLFLPAPQRWAIKAWLYWQMSALGPMAGQAHHFRKFAPEKPAYAVKRYTDEMNRLYGVLDRRLSGRDYICDILSIADFACWPWVRHHEWQGQSLGDFPNVARWFSLIGEREAVKRAIAIGDVRMAPKEAYKFLYGQTAATLAPREGQGRGE
jgi:GST-like protein